MNDSANTVILSPHFDDSVLSCGGWIAARGGTGVRVITLFAGAPPAPLPPFAAVQHRMWGDPPDPNRLRHAEDVAAHARLGCHDLHHLDAPDAVYRLSPAGEPLYGEEAAIFGPLHPEEATYAATLLESVRPLLAEGVRVLAPLGVGAHVDHQLAHLVGRSLLPLGYRVAFYEELPYVEREGALQRALGDRATWRAEPLPFGEEAMATKVAAMAYYRSQIPVLYGDDLSMSRRIRAVASAVAAGQGYAERLWVME